ncbi:MAG TPA: VTT domain-containing protein [Rhodothermales bacterium]|nr:VTT domain-containing protein [Rhodothermales bacterium]
MSGAAAWSLFLTALLAATLVPVSSEAAFVAALAAGAPPLEVFIVMSAGNALGAAITYGTGRLFADRTRRRLEASKSGQRALAWSEKHGAWALLGAWLPLVGDPLCLAAGLVRVRVLPFVLLGIGTRLARYAVLLWVMR